MSWVQLSYPIRTQNITLFYSTVCKLSVNKYYTASKHSSSLHFVSPCIHSSAYEFHSGYISPAPSLNCRLPLLMLHLPQQPTQLSVIKLVSVFSAEPYLSSPPCGTEAPNRATDPKSVLWRDVQYVDSSKYNPCPQLWSPDNKVTVYWKLATPPKP